jgi:hypothetical protein
MSAVTIPPELAALLSKLTKPTALRDAQGNCVGVFHPLFDLEEAEQIAATEQEGYTLQQVMEHLRSLEKP